MNGNDVSSIDDTILEMKSLKLEANDHLDKQEKVLDSSEASVLLLNAAKDGDRQRCQTLVGLGADVNYADKDGNTPLLRATERNYFEIVEFLVEKGGNIFKETKNNKTPVLVAGVLQRVKLQLFYFAKAMQSADLRRIFYTMLSPNYKHIYDGFALVALKDKEEMKKLFWVMHNLRELDAVVQQGRSKSDLFTLQGVSNLLNDTLSHSAEEDISKSEIVNYMSFVFKDYSLSAHCQTLAKTLEKVITHPDHASRSELDARSIKAIHDSGIDGCDVVFTVARNYPDRQPLTGAGAGPIMTSIDVTSSSSAATAGGSVVSLSTPAAATGAGTSGASISAGSGNSTAVPSPAAPVSDDWLEGTPAVGGGGQKKSGGGKKGKGKAKKTNKLEAVKFNV